MSGETPSQTAGPYFSIALGREDENLLVGADAPNRIRIEGRIFDGDRNPIEDALVEIWQPNDEGRFRHPDDPKPPTDGFSGFGRAKTDFETGMYWFDTVKPGPVPDPEGELQAPHISVIITARGMNKPSFTRLYFPGEDSNTRDMVLNMVPPERRHTLVADEVEGSDPPCYRFDIRFQGPDETVFFDF